MSGVLEQQLIEFLWNNRDYDFNFMRHLINILKCHLGGCVKEDVDGSYYCMTDNFFIHIQYPVDNLYGMRIIYRCKKLSILSNSPYPKFYSMDNIYTNDKMRIMFDDNKFRSLKLRMSFSNDEKTDVTIEWLLARNPTKSARN